MIFMKEDDAICLNDGQDVIVFPLLQEELELMLDDTKYFCNYINLKYEGEDLADEKVKAHFQSLLTRMKADKENNIWHALWVVVSVKQKAIIGRINYNSTPDVTGSVEINFFTKEMYRRQGIMTSAVNLLSTWTLDNGASTIVGRVAKDNIPAQKVLENNQFEKTEDENYFIFKKERK